MTPISTSSADREDAAWRRAEKARADREDADRALRAAELELRAARGHDLTACPVGDLPAPDGWVTSEGQLWRVGEVPGMSEDEKVREVTPVTEENVVATFEHLVGEAPLMMQRGIARAFTGSVSTDPTTTEPARPGTPFQRSSLSTMDARTGVAPLLRCPSCKAVKPEDSDDIRTDRGRYSWHRPCEDAENGPMVPVRSGRGG